MLARLDPRFLDRVAFPLGDADEGRRRARRPAAAGLAAARRAESQEACFLAGDDYRSFLAAARPAGERQARSSTTTAGALGEHDGYWRFTPGQRRGLGVAAPEPLYAVETDAAHEHGRGRAARGACPDTRHGARAPLRAGRRGPRRSSATARRRCPPRSSRRHPASGCGSTSRPTASRAARRPFSTTATPSSVPASSLVGSTVSSLGFTAVIVAFSFGDLADLALAVFLVAVGLGVGWAFLRLAVTFRPAFFVHPRNRT